jgi:hypothetical protein
LPNDGRKVLKKSDITVSAVIILLAAVCFFALKSGKGAQAVISAGGEEVKTIPLENYGIYYIDEADIEFTVDEKGICVSHSDCPDKICEKTGYIHSKGQSIVCLPNRVSVRITSDKEDTESNIDIILN